MIGRLDFVPSTLMTETLSLIGEAFAVPIRAGTHLRQFEF